MPKFDKTQKIFKEASELAKQEAINNLLKSGLDANFIQPLLKKLNSAVLTNSNLDNLIDELSNLIKGDKLTKGILERYVKQASHDALIQFNRIYTQLISTDLGIVFYRYTGTRIRDTRPFCNRYVGMYFHEKEIEQLGDGIDPITGEQLDSDFLQGRIKDTNSSNILINAGGWNCRHAFDPINTQFVPKNVLIRNIKNGNFSPSKEQMERLGIAA